MQKESSVPKLPLEAPSKSKGQMLKQISPRRDNRTSPLTSPSSSSGNSPSSSPKLSSSAPSSTSSKRFSLFGKKSEEAPTAIPSNNLSRGSIGGGSGGGNFVPYEELVWAQVVNATSGDSDDFGGEGGEGGGGGGGGGSRKAKRSTSTLRASSRKNSESGEEGSAGTLLALKRGQLVLVLEGVGQKRQFGYVGGSAGYFDKSNVKLMDGSLAPRCPLGDNIVEWGSLLNVVCMNNFRLISMFFDAGLGSMHAAKLTAYLSEVIRVKDVDVRPLMRTLIAVEVKNTSEYQMLFRGNTVAAKLLSQFAKVAGGKFLDTLLRPLIRLTTMSEHEQVEFYEAGYIRKRNLAKRRQRDKEFGGMLDAIRTGGGNEDDDNDEVDAHETSSEENERKELNSSVAQLLWQSTELFLDVLFGSVKNAPVALKMLAADMRAVAEPKFADYHLVLTGFFVLRFIAPALAAPESFHVECLPAQGLSANAKKRLVQVSKIVQAVASNQVFKAGGNLDVLNDKIGDVNNRMKSFFDDFASIGGGQQRADDSWKNLTSIADADSGALITFWELCKHALPALAKYVMQSDNEEDRRVLASLVDCITGLPMSQKD